MQKNTKKYGWLRDIPDGRDYLYGALAVPIKLPAAVDLRSGCSPVENQGQLGSCTANALAGNLEFLDNRTDHTYEDVSRLFIYLQRTRDAGNGRERLRRSASRGDQDACERRLLSGKNLALRYRAIHQETDTSLL